MTPTRGRPGRAACVVLLGLLLFGATAADGQVTIGTGAEFTGYGFDPGLGADAAELLVLPVAVRLALNDRFDIDVSSAWARGRVEIDDTRLKLAGPVDTRVRISTQAAPWARVTVGAQLPTGNSSHDSEEAVVASVLSTDLLGFRENNWGSGTALTTSVATATRAGSWGVGIAAAYALRGSFHPNADVDSVRYTPGDETRVRVGLDRNFGTNTLTLGGTFITYAEDRANGRNLFRSGDRFRFDVSYQFRASAGLWTLYAADVARTNGDLTLQVVDDLGGTVGDSTVATAEQNMLVGGLVGAIGLGSGFVFRPHLDLKLQTRSEPDGSDAGSGWRIAAGGDVPARLFGRTEFFPRARVLVGSIRDRQGESVPLLGMELGGTIRWSP